MIHQVVYNVLSKENCSVRSQSEKWPSLVCFHLVANYFVQVCVWEELNYPTIGPITRFLKSNKAMNNYGTLSIP